MEEEPKITISDFIFIIIILLIATTMIIFLGISLIRFADSFVSKDKLNKIKPNKTECHYETDYSMIEIIDEYIDKHKQEILFNEQDYQFNNCNISESIKNEIINNYGFVYNINWNDSDCINNLRDISSSKWAINFYEKMKKEYLKLLNVL